MRLDIYLVNSGLCETRSKSQDIIKNGYVTVNKEIIVKPSFTVSELDSVEISTNEHIYVSRSANKLKQALNDFNIDLRELVVLDIGASTGGFTECALEAGASFVYAVDVGKEQLHQSLRNNPNICSMEQTDARDLSVASFKRAIDFVCVDVSFISVRNILPSIVSLLYDNKEVVILVKPQFELERKYLNKKGIVKEEKLRIKALKSIKECARELGFKILDHKECKLPGRDGNIEYLLYLKK